MKLIGTKQLFIMSIKGHAVWCPSHYIRTSLIKMKLLAAVLVVLAISQTLAFPTNDNGGEIGFSEDSNVHRQQRMVFLQGNDAESLEQSLDTYAELLKELNQKSIPRMRPNEQATVTSDVAYDQTANSSCNDITYDCSQVKYNTMNHTHPENGDPCTVFTVPYCQGVCTSSYK